MEDKILFPEIALFCSNCKQSLIVVSKISKVRKRRQKIKARLLKVEVAVRKETPSSVPERPPPSPCGHSVQEASKKMGTMEFLDSVPPPLSHNFEGIGMSHVSEKVDLSTTKFLVVEISQRRR